VKTVASAAIALLGALRYKLGALLLRLFLHLNRHRPAPTLFASGWKFIWALRWLFEGKEDYGNRYWISWRNFAYMLLLVGVKRIDPSFVPPLRAVNEEALRRVAGDDRPVVLVTMHARLVSCINKVLEDFGIASSVIAISEDTRRVSKLFGLKGEVDIIPLDSDSLVIARKKLKAGRLVCCCADFTVRRSGSLHHDRYVAEGLFTFAARQRASIVYALATVTEAGEVVINVYVPKITDSTNSPRDLAADFVRFAADTLEELPAWKIGSWGLRALSSDKQYDNYWLRPLGQVRKGWQPHAGSSVMR
jgi:hypothetical protein